jgi:hypothetical protein
MLEDVGMELAEVNIDHDDDVKSVVVVLLMMEGRTDDVVEIVLSTRLEVVIGMIELVVDARLVTD